MSANRNDTGRDANATRDAVGGLLEQWQEAFDAGRDIPLDDLCRDHEWLRPGVEVGVKIRRAFAAFDCPVEAPDATPPDPLQYCPGEVVGGRFTLEREIARGGSAVVWRCRVGPDGRKVAVKLPRGPHPDPERDINEQFLCEGERVRQMFHPNIVPVYSYGRHGDVAYVAFKLVEGGSLAARIVQTDRRIWPTEARSIVWHIASALAYATHEQGLIHRDLKPANVLLDPGGWVYLTDFGIALTLDEAADGAAGATGTWSYMAPEQFTGAPLHPSCDVYSFGVILYQLLTGRLPARSGEPCEDPALSYFCPLLWRCLATEPEDRYPSARELLAALRLLMPPWAIPGRQAPAPTPSVPPPPPVPAPVPAILLPKFATPTLNPRQTVIGLAAAAAVTAVVALAAVGGPALLDASRDHVPPGAATAVLIGACLAVGVAIIRPQRTALGCLVVACAGLVVAAVIGSGAGSLLRSVAGALNSALRLP